MSEQYALLNIQTNEVVVPDIGDSDYAFAMRNIFHDPIGVTLANDSLRDAGSVWRWIRVHGDQTPDPEPRDLGGAWDGFTVTSDADGGL